MGANNFYYLRSVDLTSSLVTALTTHGIQRILQCNTIMRDYNVPCLTIQEKCFSNTASVTSVQLSSQVCSSMHTIPTNTGRIRIFTARRHTLGSTFGTGIYCPFARAVNTDDAYPATAGLSCGLFFRTAHKNLCPLSCNTVQ
jgi:hypothetical protein